MRTHTNRVRTSTAVGRALAVMLGAAALMVSAAGLAQGPIFRWVDRDGNLHLSDELADVPEPFRAMYAAKLREAAEAKRNGGAPAVPAPAPKPEVVSRPPEANGPSIIDEEAARRQRWKKEVASWRARLASATEDLAAAEARVVAEVETDPLLANTPLAHHELLAARQARVNALERIEEARRMLLTELPARARREGVPPAWLM